MSDTRRPRFYLEDIPIAVAEYIPSEIGGAAAGGGHNGDAHSTGTPLTAVTPDPPSDINYKEAGNLTVQEIHAHRHGGQNVDEVPSNSTSHKSTNSRTTGATSALTTRTATTGPSPLRVPAPFMPPQQTAPPPNKPNTTVGVNPTPFQLNTAPAHPAAHPAAHPPSGNVPPAVASASYGYPPAPPDFSSQRKKRCMCIVGGIVVALVVMAVAAVVGAAAVAGGGGGSDSSSTADVTDRGNLRGDETGSPPTQVQPTQATPAPAMAVVTQASPTPGPSVTPTLAPSASPTSIPTMQPSAEPTTPRPSPSPTRGTTVSPSPPPTPTNIQDFVDSGLWYQIENDSSASSILHGENVVNSNFPSDTYGVFASSRAPAPFLFTSTLSVVLRVTDLYDKGQQITVFDNGVSIGMTTVPGGAAASCGSTNPETCFADADMSSGLFVLPPGDHALEFYYQTGSANNRFSAFRLDTIGTSPVYQLTASDGATGDIFGNGVIDGDTILVGAHGDDPAGTSSGSAYIFTRGSDGRWTQQAKLVPNDGAADDQFGYGWLALSGDRAAVPSHQDDPNGTNSGSVYIFERTAGTNTWSQTTKLSEGSTEDYFGYDTAMDGNVLVITSRRGRVYIYENNGGTDWSLQRTITYDFTSDDYRVHAAISGDTIAIGLPWDNSSNGRVEVYVKNGTNWSLQDTLFPNSSEASILYGWSLSVDGDTLAVSSPWDNGSVNQGGAVYVYERVGGLWSLQNKIYPSDAKDSDNFGRQLSVEGNHLIVGTNADIAVYLYTRVGSAWAGERRIGESLAGLGDGFGTSVEISGNSVIVAAGSDDDRGTNSGSLYVFTI